MPGSPRDPLLLGLATGAEQFLEAVYDRFGVRLYRVAFGLLGSAEDAEDAVQELFVALVRGRDRLASVDDLESYLFVSLRRTVARTAVRRKRQPRTQDPAELGDAIADCSGAVSQEGFSEDLNRALAQLPAAQREVITLKIEGQLTFAQIGRVLGTSPNTAASRYRYALEKLRAAWKKHP